ncbi:MAG: DegT/DnrJ/EryC1/StrS aminotransferase family protein [Nanoarchaeota archaeon]|nr:DegT/DnrJ/EryC1/StrS aminotransferase family protein [Nanoarchaeota archaeon]
MKIPFCKTTIGEEEKKAICDVIDSGWVVLGAKSQEFEEKFAEYVGAKYAVYVDSGTSALLLSLNYLKDSDLIDDDLLIVPSLTFTATAEAAINAGYLIEFGDVDYNTLCLKTNVNDKITLPVHLVGNKATQKALIFDSAHRIERDDVKGSDALWCYSFYATKNMTTVQGGMVATNDVKAYEWLKSARDHGLDMGTKERYTGKYKQYDVKFVGYRVKGDDLRAAIGLEQLKKLPEMTKQRNEIVKRYNDAFGLERAGNHVYPILVNDRDKFMELMMEAGIQCTIHFRPLHQMTGYKKYYDAEYSPALPNTDFIGEHIVSLPLFPGLTEAEQDYIISEVKKTKLLYEQNK